MTKTEELRRCILQYFEHIASGENIRECIREAIFLHLNFNPLLLMDLVSSDGQTISKADLYEYLQASNINFDEEELEWLFKSLGKKNNVSFNDFLDSLIPYSPDVLRIFKKNYLTSIEISTFDPEVEFMFKELLQFEIRFLKNLNKIKREIFCFGSQSHIENMIKEDLVNENKKRDKVRESNKYKENFESLNPVLDYTDLRRFLEFWQVDRNVEYDLLQIKRYFGDHHPFHELFSFKRSPHKREGREKPFSKIESGRHFDSDGKSSNRGKSRTNSKKYYSNYKENLYDKELMEKLNIGQNQIQSAKVTNNNISRNLISEFGRTSKVHKNENDYKRNLRYKRDMKNIEGELIVKFFTEIQTKEREIENLRKHLANSSNFYLINLFKLIDHKNEGFITDQSITEFMSNGVDYQFLISHYAREEGKLRFQDFCMIFRPLSKKLNETLDGRQEHKVPVHFTFIENPFKRETSKKIKEVISMSGKLYESLDSLIGQMEEEHISPSTLFYYVDVNEKGYIEATDIQDLLEENEIQCNNKDLKCIMKMFKKRVDEPINLKEFKNFYDYF